MQNYTFEQAKANVVKIEKAANSLQNMIHATAVAFLQHWLKNPKSGKDVAEQMNLLMAASPYHAKAFAKWCAATIEVTDKKGVTSSVRLMPMRWSEENKAWYVHKDDRVTGQQFMAARDNPFWKISPAPKPNPINDFEAFENMLAKVKKHTQKPVDGDVIHMDMWKEMEQVYLTHKAAAAA